VSHGRAIISCPVAGTGFTAATLVHPHQI